MYADPLLRIVVVCAANVCRSRTAESFLRTLTAGTPELLIASAGTRVLEALPMCPIAAEFVTRHHAHADRDAMSIALTPDMLQAANLVLVSDSHVRADVVALDPDSRSRTFTLLQAAAAAQHLLQADVIARARAAATNGLTHVEEFIDGERTVVARALHDGPTSMQQWLPEELSAAQAVAHRSSSWEIADAHIAKPGNHRHILEDVRLSAGPVANVLTQLLSPERGGATHG